MFYHEKPLVGQKLTTAVQIVWQCTVLYPVVVDKTIMRQNRIKRCTTMEICWNNNEDAQKSPVVSTSRQLPNLLKN